MEVFVREGCPRCKAAHPILFEKLASSYPGLRFVERDLVKSKEATRRFQEVTTRYRVQAASVPAVHVGGRLLVGFKDADTSFREWDRVLRSFSTPCPEPMQVPRGQSSSASTAAMSMLTEWRRPPRSDRSGGLIRLASWQPVEQQVQERAPPGDRDLEEVPPRRELPPEVEPTVPPATSVADDVVTLPVLGDVNWRDWGMPAFTMAVGLIDGFNPCAMWVLLFLLSVLVNLKDRWKVLAVAGTFVVVSGLAYLAFMAAWLNVFQLVGLLRPVQIVLGLIGATVGTIHVKDFFAFKKGVSLSIPESAKPGLYARVRRIMTAENLLGALVGAAVLATLVNIIELLCTAGLPAMYTGILSMQNYPVWVNYLYLCLYIVGYMFDDSIMAGIAVVTLGHHKLQERGGRVLKLISGMVILALSGVMIFRPEWLV
ncbi:MAG TPA: hypothetical protein VM510_06700 [Caulifigura sp.]|nr:hypothetical protein [Caulifigura sp.]